MFPLEKTVAMEKYWLSLDLSLRFRLPEDLTQQRRHTG